LPTDRAQFQAPQPDLTAADDTGATGTAAKPVTKPAGATPDGPSASPKADSTADSSTVATEANLGAGLQMASIPAEVPRTSVAPASPADISADTQAPDTAQAPAAGPSTPQAGQPLAASLVSPSASPDAPAAVIGSDETAQIAAQLPAASTPDPGSAAEPAPISKTARNAAQLPAASTKDPGSAAEPAPIAVPTASRQANTPAPPSPVAAPTAAPPAPPPAGRSAAATPARAAGSSASSTGAARSSTAAPSGTGLTQPALLVAVQAQDLAPHSADAEINPATTVNAAAPDSDQTDPTDADAADPAAAIAGQAEVLTAAADPMPSAIPAVAAATMTDRKTADGETAAPGIPTRDQAASSGTASALAAGPATTAGPSAQTASAAPGSTPAGPTTPATLPAVQLAMAITRNAAGVGGAQSFTLQLKPDHLGTVDVKLDVDAKGHATANFVADRPDTLALLRQDSHHLVKSLNDAGVSTDAGSLNFSLRNSGGGFAEAQERRNTAGQALRNPSSGGAGAAAADPLPAVTQSSGTSRLYDLRA
jgi:hypothetical protein